MTKLNRINRFYDTSKYGQPQIRVYHKKGKQKKTPRYLFKCGCCDQKLEIYYAEDGLEINGVNGAIQDWRDLLLPLLRIEQEGNKHKSLASGSTRTPRKERASHQRVMKVNAKAKSNKSRMSR
jgi:hypothetical protein